MFVYIIEWVGFVHNWDPFHPKPVHFKAYLGAFVTFYIHWACENSSDNVSHLRIPQIPLSWK